LFYYPEVSTAMRTDVLTLAAAIFVIGVVVSSLGITDVFHAEAAPPAELQQGFALSHAE
jgi:hypothetical protein